MPDITYGSVCSGIEAATQAWHPLAMRAAWFAEIEPFPSAVLAHHYPDVPNHGDMTKLAAQVLAGKIPAPDVLVGGTPCQAFSVAGMREGLTDPRGALTIKYVELADAVDYVRAGQRKLITDTALEASGKKLETLVPTVVLPESSKVIDLEKFQAGRSR
ncbi:DNA cytosine methyltransferase, partial [Pseudomonas proteolytica]|uniref:DNA cytosine methyltransferase n=1 Tax=Pseudomonas proteolytica TaxID=219574 RepID=UPI0030ECEAC4